MDEKEIDLKIEKEIVDLFIFSNINFCKNRK